MILLGYGRGTKTTVYEHLISGTHNHRVFLGEGGRQQASQRPAESPKRDGNELLQVGEGMMSIENVGFVGLRSTDLPALREIFEEGLEMVPTDASSDQVGYLLTDGTRLEAYDHTNEFHNFFTTGPVVGFSVPNFDRSWERLTRIGVEQLTEIQSEDGRSWVHFRLPDGTVAELIGR